MPYAPIPLYLYTPVWFWLVQARDIVIGSLEYLSDKGKIDVFAFVLMPNHIHLIWRLNEENGKESAKGSFLKFTAHEFKKELKKSNQAALYKFQVAAANKQYEFWQRDSLGVHLFTREVALQKLDYIHNNPLADHWNLVDDPCDYKYSSARYYERNECNFTYLKDLMAEI
jgi:putative transposase